VNQERLAQLADELDTIGSWFHQPSRTARCRKIAAELRGDTVEEPPAPDPEPSRGEPSENS
jgi:hypothetical protein